jgi:hypothetical protein
MMRIASYLIATVLTFALLVFMILSVGIVIGVVTS